MKKFSKGVLLAAGFAVLAVIGHVSGFNQYVATRYNDLRCLDIMLDGNDILDSSQTTRITVGATNVITGNATISGSLTTSGTSFFTLQVSSAPRDASTSVRVTPTSAGQLVYNTTDREICVSSGTNYQTWIEVSTLAVVACRH